MKSADQKALTIYVSTDLAARIKSAADADDRSVTSYVVRLLESHVVAKPKRSTAREIEQQIIDVGRRAVSPAVEIETPIPDAASADERAGIAWFNGLTDEGRALALADANTSVVADAWTHHKAKQSNVIERIDPHAVVRSSLRYEVVEMGRKFAVVDTTTAQHVGETYPKRADADRECQSLNVLDARDAADPKQQLASSIKRDGKWPSSRSKANH